MKIVCENCEAKLGFDESRLKKSRAVGKCKECGHKIVITKMENGEPRVHKTNITKKEKIEIRLFKAALVVIFWARSKHHQALL